MKFALLFATTLSLFAASQSANAFGAFDLGRRAPARDVAAGEGDAMLAPFEHVRFCMRHPADCAASGAEAATIPADAATMATLAAVNREVNASIQPERKSAARRFQTGWSILPGAGDCNDYAVSKRHELLALGYSPASLLLSVVKTPSGEGHLVLLVRTSAGDLVLDNLTSRIRPWTETGYTWLERQSDRDPRFWVAVRAEPLRQDWLFAQFRPTSTD